MSESLIVALQMIAYVGMAVGLIGTLAPVIPGPVVIWLSVLLWSWADGFGHLGWPTLALLALLALIGEGSDLLFATAGARRGGASWQGLVISSLMALLGFMFFSFPGALVGGMGGLLVWEARRHDGDWQQVWRAGKGMIMGYVVSALVQVLVALVMIAVFVWQVWL